MGLSKEAFRKMAGTPSKEEFYEREKEHFHKCKYHVASGAGALGDVKSGMVAELGKSAELKKRKLF